MAKNTNKNQQGRAETATVKPNEETVVETKVEAEGTAEGQTEVVTEGTPVAQTGDAGAEEGEEAAQEVVVNLYSKEEIAKRIKSDLPVVPVIAEHLAKLATGADLLSIQEKESLYINIPNIFYLMNSVQARTEFPKLLVAVVDFFGEEAKLGDESPLALRYLRQSFKGNMNKFTQGLEGLCRFGPKAKRQKLLKTVNIDSLIEVYSEDRRELFVPSLEA